jgi:hypothetical protein
MSYHFAGEASVCWKSGEGGQTNIPVDGPIVKGKCMQKYRRWKLNFIV